MKTIFLLTAAALAAAALVVAASTCGVEAVVFALASLSAVAPAPRV